MSWPHWTVLPIVAPLIGALLGAWVYDALVGKRFPSVAVEPPVGRIPESSGEPA